MERNGKIFVSPPEDESDFKELFKNMAAAGAGRPLGEDGFPQGPWTPELLADAISKIDANRVGVDLRTVQLWFQDNDKGISTTNIRWLARIFGCGDKEATNDWMKALSAAQARLTAKRRDNKKTGGADTLRVPEMPAPAANHIPLTPVISVELQPMSPERPSGLAVKTEAIFSHGSHLNLPSSVFAGSSALGFLSYILGIHTITYMREDGIEKQVGFLWAPNWTFLFMVLLPLFFTIVIELLVFWKHDARPRFLAHADRPKSGNAWIQNLQANSHTYRAVFLICILFAGLAQWIGVQLIPLLEQAQDFAPSWGTIGIIRPDVLSTPAAIVFTALAYLYMSVTFYLLFAGLIILHTIIHDLWKLGSPAKPRAVQESWPGVSDAGLRIMRGVFRCTVLVILAAICMKAQSAYLASQGPDIITWMVRDVWAALTTYDDGDRIFSYRMPTHYSSLLVAISTCSVFLYGAIRLGGDRRLRAPLWKMSSAIVLLLVSYLTIDAFDGFSVLLMVAALIATYGLFDPEFGSAWRAGDMEGDRHVS
uniref:Transmembrane protein n=1 Tax=Agrobacterium albertimagni TaxID=147266 RepID=A0A7C1SZK7_9HYPH